VLVLRTVGVLALLSAAFGLWYNAMTFSTIYSDVAIESNVTEPTPFFRQAFYVMSAILRCVLPRLGVVRGTVPSPFHDVVVVVCRDRNR
jgi:hypothetical protein